MARRPVFPCRAGAHAIGGARVTRPMGAGEARYALAPLAMAVEAHKLAAWVDEAQPGETMVYASGAVPPRTAAAWVLARELSEAKLVTLTTRRDGARIEWLAERIGVAPVAAPAAGGEDSLMMRVVRVVLEAANANAPCPTDGELAAICGLSGADAANYRLRKAVKAGLVTLQSPRFPGERRIATDPASGRSTRPAMVA